MASRFIEYMDSSENASKIFFSSTFLMLGRKKVEIGETAIRYLPTAIPVSLLSSLIFIFLN